MPEQCSSCGGICGKGGCKQRLMYPHNWAAQDMQKAEKQLRKAVKDGYLKGERAKQATSDADALFNMRLKWG